LRCASVNGVTTLIYKALVNLLAALLRTKNAAGKAAAVSWEDKSVTELDWYCQATSRPEKLHV